ncbi:hypothetical protein QUC31_009048 [Theobroma cacao]
MELWREGLVLKDSSGRMLVSECGRNYRFVCVCRLERSTQSLQVLSVEVLFSIWFSVSDFDLCIVMKVDSFWSLGFSILEYCLNSQGDLLHGSYRISLLSFVLELLGFCGVIHLKKDKEYLAAVANRSIYWESGSKIYGYLTIVVFVGQSFGNLEVGMKPISPNLCAHNMGLDYRFLLMGRLSVFAAVYYVTYE